LNYSFQLIIQLPSALVVLELLVHLMALEELMAVIVFLEQLPVQGEVLVVVVQIYFPTATPAVLVVVEQSGQLLEQVVRVRLIKVAQVEPQQLIRRQDAVAVAVVLRLLVPMVPYLVTAVMEFPRLLLVQQ
jgi:hypothetical protein